MGKYGTENTPYLDFFYAVLAEISVVPNVRSSLIVSVNITYQKDKLETGKFLFLPNCCNEQILNFCEYDVLQKRRPN